MAIKITDSEDVNDDWSGNEGTPVVSSAALGFRHWTLNKDNLTLHSAAGGRNDLPWQQGANISSCYKHKAPGSECHCGFNAYADPHQALEGPYDGVFGSIAGSGDMEIHADYPDELGFRAQRAQILALYYKKGTPCSWKELQEVAREYKVPAFKSLAKFLEYSLSKATDMTEWIASQQPASQKITNKTPKATSPYPGLVGTYQSSVSLKIKKKSRIKEAKKTFVGNFQARKGGFQKLAFVILALTPLLVLATATGAIKLLFFTPDTIPGLSSLALATIILSVASGILFICFLGFEETRPIFLKHELVDSGKLFLSVAGMLFFTLIVSGVLLFEAGENKGINDNLSKLIRSQENIRVETGSYTGDTELLAASTGKDSDIEAEDISLKATATGYNMVYQEYDSDPTIAVEKTDDQVRILCESGGGGDFVDFCNDGIWSLAGASILGNNNSDKSQNQQDLENILAAVQTDSDEEAKSNTSGDSSKDSRTDSSSNNSTSDSCSSIYLETDNPSGPGFYKQRCAK